MFRKLCSAAGNILIIAAALFFSLMAVLLLMGLRPYVVRSGSMEPALQTGSLCFVNVRASYQDMKQGDVAAFRLSGGGQVLHRVIQVTEEGMETKGDANDLSDGISVTEGNYIGKAIFSVPALGYLIVAVQSGKGKILCFTGIVCLLIAGMLSKKKPVNRKEKHNR